MSLQSILYPLRTHSSYFRVLDEDTCFIESSFYHPTSTYQFCVTHHPLTKTILFNDCGNLFLLSNRNMDVFLEALKSASTQSSIPTTFQLNPVENLYEVIFLVNSDDPNGILISFQKIIRYWIAFESVTSHVLDELERRFEDDLKFDEYRNQD